MQNSMVVFTFSVLGRKYPFWANLVEKVKNCQFKLKYGTLTNSKMQTSMVQFTFSVLNRKYPFWANSVQKIKIFQFKLKFGT